MVYSRIIVGAGGYALASMLFYPRCFVAYSMSGGRERGHDYAVRFNYPAELLEADPGMVPDISVNMAMALTPSSPREQFAALDRPFALWIGSEDELFVPEKVMAFGDLAAHVRSRSQVGAIAGAKHLSILYMV